ncbi:MAG TPA: class I SAM-dependent methyltransferase [Gaiellaceae bacterium]|nr:class I SAM-dependent methyltransferase [Gaiellaceae bacterium]
MSPQRTRLNDPELVAREYASEERFLARRVALVDYVEGPNAEELAFDAVAEVSPRRVLEVGSGTGEFAARLARDLGAEVTAVDVSPRMVELARARGVSARVADVQSLPFGDGEFDCVAALWVLHHVTDLDRGLGELARVLRAGGRLVAATFGRENLADLYERLGAPSLGDGGFSRESGEAPLRRRFDRVERRDADGAVVFPDRDALREYLRSLALVRGPNLAERLPEFAGPFRALARHSVFVAEKAA